MFHQPIETASRPGPDSKWTAETRTRFLDHLARKGCVRSACLLVGVSPEIAYRLRRRDAAFARGWAAAMVIARTEAEQVLAEQALEGLVEDVYYRGEWIGSKRRYDARLLLAHLARLDKLADDPQALADAARFDELLAVVAGEQLPYGIDCLDDVLPVSRPRHVAEAAEFARIEYIRTRPDEEKDEAGADEDDPLDAEDRWQREAWAEELREAACHDAMDEAAFKAGEAWDRWQARARAAVDRALAEASPIAPAPVDAREAEIAAEHCQQRQQSGGPEGEP